MTIAGPPYRKPDACHGPCYVLDPFAWELGERLVLYEIQSPEAVAPTPRSVASPPHYQTRRVVTADSIDFRFVEVRVRKAEPAWYARARELRAAGWSVRRIMKELGVGQRQLKLAGVL